MKNDTRSAFLAPFRADRATTESDIIVRMAADDLRQFGTPVAHKMSVYSVSAFLAETLFLVKNATNNNEIGLGPSQQPRRASLRFWGATAARMPRKCVSRP